MTDRELMQMALTALERGETQLRYEAITALRAAIEEAEKPWQGLTEEDREEILRWVEWKEIGSDQSVAPQKLIAYVEKKLREKNNG